MFFYNWTKKQAHREPVEVDRSSTGRSPGRLWFVFSMELIVVLLSYFKVQAAKLLSEVLEEKAAF